MDYWHRAGKIARANTKTWTLPKAVPSALAPFLQYFFFHGQTMQRVILSAALIVGVYIALYVLEYIWKLLLTAPTVLDKEREQELAQMATTMQGEKERSEAEISTLNERIQALGKRPYSQAHEVLTRQKFEPLSQEVRETLKFILHHPGVEARLIPVPSGAQWAMRCYHGGFLDRSEDRPGNGIVLMATYYTVKESFRTVLEDIFYPISS